MATNLNYNVSVNTTQGVQALNNLQNKVGGLNSAFDGLRNAIAGIAIGSIVTNLIGFADNIKDLSEATGIATDSILGFQRAVQAFGGSTEGADKAILRLVTNIGEAVDGSAPLQAAFARVGVSLKDLASLSEQEILEKTIRGLQSVTDKSEQARLKSQLLGKEFRGVATSGLAEAFAQQTFEANKYVRSIEEAARLQDTLDQAISKVKLTLLQIIEPTAKFINSLDPTRIAEAIEGFTKLAAVITALYGFARLVVIVEGFAAALTGAAGAAALFGINILKNFTLIGKVITAIGAVVLGFKTLFPEAAGAISDSFGKAVDAAKEFFGIKSPKFLDQAEVERENYLLQQRAKVTKDTGDAAREVKDPFEQLRRSLNGLAEEYARVNQLNIQQLQNQTALIGKSREESEVSKAKTELLKRESDEIRKLEEQRSRLTKEQQDAGLGKVIDEQIAKIKEQTRADIDATEAAVRNNQERLRAFDLEKFARQSQIDVEKELRRIQDDIAKSTMSEIERKSYDILAAARERAEAEIKAEEARRGSLLTDQEKLKFYEAAKKGTDELIAKERELYDSSRTFSFGWRKAFQEYTDNATNAALQAQRIFQKATQGMEDAIVGFVKTGKFEFKSFVNSMLEELLRSQIRQVMAQILSISGGTGQASGGGLFGQIGNFLGFANGGIIPTNEPVIVGERGPELLMGAAGRNVIPNEKLGSSNYVTYNINAVDARSFKDMIAADPTFIHAVAMQGAKAAPGRR